eukprot:4056682-Prymnesium_polylepis.1
MRDDVRAGADGRGCSRSRVGVAGAARGGVALKARELAALAAADAGVEVGSGRAAAVGRLAVRQLCGLRALVARLARLAARLSRLVARPLLALLGARELVRRRRLARGAVGLARALRGRP